LNRFRVEEEDAVPTLRIDPAVERAQVERLRALRERRDNAQTEAALSQLEEAARGTENLLPRILRCVETYATVGEISHRLRRIWGEYREAVTV
ncbi:MAG TPA: methylmalonyl-CoA mutase family protein, partial [Pyrinomonadaceae bacterium]|nr:methylmalonyl-CoA mutase family protein [Pyrinomonadaceae bacterium]